MSDSASKARSAYSPKRVLWVTFEDPLLPAGKIEPTSRPGLFTLNCDGEAAFAEYIGLKLGAGSLTRFFVGNKLVHYLSKAAPGIHELVLLGKVWHERKNFDHVVVDMPSTGYGLAMFHSAKNFSRLFQGGPIQRDAEAMLQTLGSAQESLHLVVALPEEMPLQEGLELAGFLKELFPSNPPAFLANRLMPEGPEAPSPPRQAVTRSASEYLSSRRALERENLELWRAKAIRFDTLPYLAEAGTEGLEERLAERVASLLKEPAA